MSLLSTVEVLTVKKLECTSRFRLSFQLSLGRHFAAFTSMKNPCDINYHRTESSLIVAAVKTTSFLFNFQNFCFPGRTKRFVAFQYWLVINYDYWQKTVLIFRALPVRALIYSPVVSNGWNWSPGALTQAFMEISPVVGSSLRARSVHWHSFH